MVPFALYLEMHFCLNRLLCYPSPLTANKVKHFVERKESETKFLSLGHVPLSPT